MRNEEMCKAPNAERTLFSAFRVQNSEFIIGNREVKDD